jgi:fatty acid desaturase
MNAAHSTDRPEAAKVGLRVETWLFIGLTGFFAIAAVVYTIFAPQELVGITALILTTGLTLIIGSFLLFVSRRLEGIRPEDDDDAEISDGAGDLGFFSPGSYYPFFLAATVALVAVATAYLLVWLMVIGIGMMLWVICGLVYEYHRRPITH